MVAEHIRSDGPTDQNAGQRACDRRCISFGPASLWLPVIHHTCKEITCKHNNNLFILNYLTDQKKLPLGTSSTAQDAASNLASE